MPAAPRPDPRRALGTSGEDAVARWYEREGYEILDRNWRVREGEIDLVVRRGTTVVFCEVKTRRGTGFGFPAEAVTVAKQRRLRGLALTGARRSARVPQVPTMAESGYPGFDVVIWFGLLAPAQPQTKK